MVVQRLQSVAGLQSKLLSCKKQAEALEKVARSERSTRFEQVETVLRLPETYRLWCLEVYHRNCFFDSLLEQVVLHLLHLHPLTTFTPFASTSTTPTTPTYIALTSTIHASRCHLGRPLGRVVPRAPSSR